ncbi:hypothetical protein [Acinetobacter sp. TR3]|jgi:sulfur transfer complex TusBCD TusB component (DsrH family)|uniref:hypothetical protein n=1 Tax=Acinetobacter sp. TR3 TaxID=3003392 RepID=UPI0022AC5E8A|nr:hypothetical protein [Acinetobacter sp. TR3]WAU75272.1 hypothetical protein O1449_08045 [Acinetobacter sp. TR3]
MENSTLFLIQSPYYNTDKIWIELAQMAHVNDTVVVMGDGLLVLTKKIVDLYSNLYCLSNEQSLLRDEIKSEVKVIEYAEFADLVLQFKRCISLK